VYWVSGSVIASSHHRARWRFPGWGRDSSTFSRVICLWYQWPMAISLTSEQQARLSAYVARGDFSSVEEAASQFIDERIAERTLEEGDSLAWAKSYVDEALEGVARGNIISHEEYRARVEAHLASLEG